MYLFEQDARLDLMPDYASENFMQMHFLENLTLSFLFQEFLLDGSLQEISKDC